jgi:hypothetical protein
MLAAVLYSITLSIYRIWEHYRSISEKTAQSNLEINVRTSSLAYTIIHKKIFNYNFCRVKTNRNLTVV